MGRLMRAAAGVAAVLSLSQCATRADDAAPLRLSGRVLDAQGQPLGGVPVGFIRVRSLPTAPDAPVQAEAAVRTGADGSFRLEVPAATPGCDQVIGFTSSPLHANQFFGGAPIQGDTPTAAEARAAGVQVLDLHHPPASLELRLSPGAGAPARQVARVRMRDGVELATDVYLPRRKGPWPVLVIRTPYGRQGFAGQASVATAAGYAVVVQDSRGRFDSGGENLAFIGDGWGAVQDGYDTAKWIVAQPWCNGKLGSQGGSAMGITQLLTAPTDPPGYVAQEMSVPCSSLYHHAAYVGGAFCKSLLEGWMTGNKFDPRNLQLAREHESYDAYWQQFDVGPQAARVHLPGLFSGGWYDVFTQGTLDAFMQRQYAGGDGARGRQKLLMGPWPHARRRNVGELVYPENALQPPGPNGWFDYWLKGVDNHVMDQPAVTYYLMGAVGEPGAPGNVWRTADVWPVPSQPTPLYLAADGMLARQAPAAQMSRTYRYDPNNPVKTRGGNNLTIPAGPMDQRPVEDRPDVLLFTTAPLTEPLAITGRVTARLWVASSALDTDFTVKLTDVYPDGRSMLVLDGIRRMRYRNGFERPELLTPGQVYPVEVDLWSTSLVFNRGHRLRVAVSSSNYPRFEANPNTGKRYVDSTEKVVAENTLHLGGECPSQVILPVVPLPRWPGREARA